MGARRAVEQMARMASELRVARSTLALSQADVAKRAGVDRLTVVRAEAGTPGMEVSTLTAVMTAVGLDLVMNAYPGRSISLRDTGQMQLADQIRRLAAAQWRPQIEESVGEHGRSADLVFYGADEILHLEIERRAIDFQAQLRSALRKWEVLAGRGERPVRLVLAFEDTTRNREALALHADLISSRLPANSREVMRALRGGQPLGRDGLLWMRRR